MELSQLHPRQTYCVGSYCFKCLRLCKLSFSSCDLSAESFPQTTYFTFKLLILKLFIHLLTYVCICVYVHLYIKVRG